MTRSGRQSCTGRGGARLESHRRRTGAIGTPLTVQFGEPVHGDSGRAGDELQQPNPLLCVHEQHGLRTEAEGR